MRKETTIIEKRNFSRGRLDARVSELLEKLINQIIKISKLIMVFSKVEDFV